MMGAAHIASASGFALFGTLMGFFYLKLLSLNIRALIGQSHSLLTLSVSLGRAIILLAGFVFAVVNGALALLAALGGFLLTRAILTRRPEFLLP